MKMTVEQLTIQLLELRLKQALTQCSLLELELKIRELAAELVSLEKEKETQCHSSSQP